MVEHVGDALTVTSPGGFPGTVRPENIITHPSSPRYRSLAEAMASLRLAEREGIGVDRMVGDMLALGRPEPEIIEMEGPAVRVSLLGGEPDREIIGLLGALEPHEATQDLDIVLLVDHLSRKVFIDIEGASRVLQRSVGETEAAIGRARRTTIEGQPLVVDIHGVPAGHVTAFRLSDVARQRLPTRTGQATSGVARNRLILRWANSRGRISSTETADLTGLSVVRAGQILTDLEQEGELEPGRQNRIGRGFFYRPADP